LAVSTNQTSILCNGGGSTITITANGGTAPYIGTGTFIRPAGTYSFTVSDAGGCQSTVSVTITEPTALAASSVAGTIACNGGGTTVTVTAIGGTAPYIGVGNFTSGPGTQVYTVIDANGCQSTSSITINQPAALTATASATPTNCPTCTDGAVSISSVSGGTAPYQYSDLTNLASGYYCITVTDANGCTTQACGLVNSTSCAMTATATAGSIPCNGGTATVNVLPVGGTAPFVGAGTFTQAAGTTTYVVSDVFGCFAITSVSLSEPTALVASSTTTDAPCFATAGSVTVNATGGTAPYSGTGTYPVAAGTYSYSVTDANGCISSVTAVVNQPTVLIASSSVSSPIACNGGTAIVSVSVNGGTAPYSGTGSFTVNAGTHTFTVTDANGCSASTSITVTQPAVLSTGAVPVNVTCFGGANGSVSVSPTGGTSPYSMNWSNGGTGISITALTAGTYTVTVTDANGCVATTPVQVSQPQPFPSLGSIQGTASACLTYGVGTAVFSVAPITDGVNSTTYVWTPPTGMTILSGQGTPTVTLTWTALAIDQSIAGNLSVTASNSCESRNNQVFVSYATTAPVTPGSISGPSKLCSGDMATFSVSAAARATHYVWSMPAGLTITGTGQSNVITVSVGASFAGGTIGVQAANACGISPVRTRSTALNYPLTPGTITGPANGLCNVDMNFSIASVSGATSYLWTLPSGVAIVSGQGTTTIRASFGSFTSGTATVQSVNGCGLSAVRSFTITGSPARPTAITVSGTPCAGGSPVTYTASTSGSATSYTWQSTTGATVLSGQGTKSLNVQWSAGSLGTSQNLTVRASNSCGSSTTRAHTLTVPACVREASITSPDLNITVFPNPLTEGSIIRLENPADSRYSLTVIDLAGRVLQTEQGVLPAGPQVLSLKDVRSLPVGVYLLDLNLDGSRNVIRVVVE